eukprot:TRINITY_DN10756_c0_g1_i1.p1 TRINITY_DN10756_c0_g1~~TRINITY_DN10756_c0_g1_i1.p1  ORF type:complete len:1088 (+),score=124.87 TRINITY_DN10756_c0_g1_i1:76-3339(+)
MSGQKQSRVKKPTRKKSSASDNGVDDLAGWEGGSSRSFAYLDYFSEVETANFHCMLCKSSKPPTDPANLSHVFDETNLIEAFIGPYPHGKVAIKSVFVHKICAGWSADVYLDSKDQYQNVPFAIDRAMITKCSHCKKTGATVSCIKGNCTKIYHVQCALSASCLFLPEMKEMYCSHHVDSGLQRQVELSKPKPICSICTLTGVQEPKNCDGCRVFYHVNSCSPEWKVGNMPRWTHRGGIEVCQTCAQIYDRGDYCSVCHVPFAIAHDTELLDCSICHGRVHKSCEQSFQLSRKKADKSNQPELHICSQCHLLDDQAFATDEILPKDEVLQSEDVRDDTNNDQSLWSDYTDPANRLNLKMDSCLKCMSTCEGTNFLTCYTCGESFHNYCLPFSIWVPENKRSTWQCSQCKTCSYCHKDVDDQYLLLCDGCDSAYHLYCLDSNLEQIPDGSWFCDECVSCLNCGVTSSTVWSENFRLCSPCFKKKQVDRKCDHCQKTFEGEAISNASRCGVCKGWYHIDCLHASNDSSSVDCVAVSGLICYKCHVKSKSNQFHDQDMDDFQIPHHIRQTEGVSSTFSHTNTLISAHSLHPNKRKDLLSDTRRCCLCNRPESQFEGRLLFCDTDVWVHTNCAYWSPEVYESPISTFRGVQLAIGRGRLWKCTACSRSGATLNCVIPSCDRVFHFKCAHSQGCAFLADKTIFCQKHIPQSLPERNIVKHFGHERFLVVADDERSGVKVKTASLLGLRIGALELQDVGHLIDSELFHNQCTLFPAGYHACRVVIYDKDGSRKKIVVQLRIDEDEKGPIFTIQSGSPMIIDLKSTSMAEVIQMFLKMARKHPEHHSLDGLSFFGLSRKEIKKRIESVVAPGQFPNYLFRHQQRPTEPARLVEEEKQLESGCSRCECLLDFVMQKKKAGTQSASSKSHQRTYSTNQESAAITDAAKFRAFLTQPKVYIVGRSYIHGWGLYANRDISVGEMIIEYTGELIRKRVADIREKQYEARNIGCYMFRLDGRFIVDATMAGNVSRFVNHSCEPNCMSKIVEFESKKKIMLMARKPILRGEEITYDYCFEIEADNRIPCRCGAESCRGFMN